MAEVADAHGYYSRMLGPKAGNMWWTERCRERRRRRILLRRNAAVAAANGDLFPWRRSGGGGVIGENPGQMGGSASTAVGFPLQMGAISWMPRNGGFVIRESVQQGFVAAAGGPVAVPHPAVEAARENAVPVVGAVAVAGRQSEMEDAVTIRTSLCSPAINRRRPVHYFGVYDGHGGPHFAIMCKENMHAILKEELMRLPMPPPQNQTGASSSRAAPPLPPPELTADESGLQEAWRRIITHCFWRTEMVALQTCSCGSVGFFCSCDRSTVAYSGSTAVAVILTEKHIVVGNCGDSRAVLYRGGRIVPLSFDHKPDRADENARIVASGGRVFKTDTYRVEGILAMSRAIGDKYLKPYVVSEPEVTFTRRDAEDEFLIIASDGLWDVMPTEMICRVTRECLKEQRATVTTNYFQDLNATVLEYEGLSTVFPSRSASAAALLTRLALARKSSDNICVVVVDLKRVV